MAGNLLRLSSRSPRGLSGGQEEMGKPDTTLQLKDGGRQEDRKTVKFSNTEGIWHLQAPTGNKSLLLKYIQPCEESQ